MPSQKGLVKADSPRVRIRKDRSGYRQRTGRTGGSFTFKPPRPQRDGI